MKINAFSVSFDQKKVLDFPGFTFEQGKIYAIIGSNGSGKSTFVKGVAGIYPPDEGKVSIEPEVSVGYMPQKSYAFRMSTLKNMMLNTSDGEKAKERLAAMGILELADKRGHKLSGGETARMSLGRLLVKHYDLVLLDEPCASMDMEGTLLSEKLICEYCKKENAAVIIVTHSLQQAKRLSDETLYFHKGNLCEYGATKEILNTPKEKETKIFLEFFS